MKERQTVGIQRKSKTNGLTTIKDTVRLLELGYEEFFQNVPCAKDNILYIEVLKKMYEIHPSTTAWRDIHNIWQWGHYR